MMKLTRRIRAKSHTFNRLCTIYTYYYHKSLRPDQYPHALKQWFMRETGRDLDLEHPKTYNEKIQWMKLYDSTQVKADLSDKYVVREWVKDTIGEQYLIPLLGVWNKFDDIDFDKLPNQFVLKANHGSTWNIIVPDKSKLNITSARRKMNRWLKTDFAFVEGFQLHYSLIDRKIIAEEFIENNGNNLYDYKIHCFNGTPQCIEYIGNRSSSPREIYMTTDWKPFPYYDGVFPLFDELPPVPLCLNKLIELAATLSSGFNYVRCDFYVLDNGDIRFGEMTFTPGSGKYIWQPDPIKGDEYMGSLLELPIKS